MKFLYNKYPAKKGEVIEVALSSPAKVKFMTAAEFRKYAGSRTHTYYRGREDGENVRIILPFDSVWHAVVEKGNAELSATTKLCPPSAAIGQGGYPLDGALGDVDEELQSLSLGSRSEG